MIGLFNEKQRITQHLNNFVENKNVMQCEIEALKVKTNKINELETTVTKLKDEAINQEDLNELVQDIRTSFELFLNSNHTPRQDRVESELKNIQTQLNNLEGKINVLFNGKVEVIEHNEEVKDLKKSSKIPKLEITRKKYKYI